jgi:hypothetical protein
MRTIILIFILLFSCSAPEYKTCEFTTTDNELKLYHDILTELIEQHFLNSFLAKVSGELEGKYPAILDFSDTAAFQKDLIQLQNKVFNDTSKFATLCYQPTLKSGPWRYFNSQDIDFLTTSKAEPKYWNDIKAFLTSFSSSWKAVADTIAKSQTKYTSKSFKLCTSKLVACERFNESDIGVVSLSKVFMNDKRDQGLLYYEFTCGGKCGMGEIVLVQYIKKWWTIKKVLNLWIS